ncbi:large-conductance mechanosensitive channel protein MscL [Lactobacillus sp. ESL0731]|uniref:large-conductance mechanosensitive channel protein MscL n=1 Tax=unclassified Lactobacillus TaxID=2620435 RepID=UPI0023F848B0|nr:MULTISPECIES: large-conductance mechanosensitive channel protein MscL [unclassified Lactobacillus]WEV51496.1 large-conductance mechanosensitive channel protein MscL [Lactobacillus sp. ESL0700]WEV62625.1 large-conductance mechanosensitive channel protein MscL [Lactobacillus sp. ESL0731]
MLKEFKEFIQRGNVIDLAVGVIIGGAFTNIVNSLVNNLINPLIGLFIGKIDLSNLVLRVGGATFKYGAFINTVINFLIIALIVFFLVKGINRLTKHQPEKEAPAGPTTDDYLREIRDLLKEK